MSGWSMAIALAQAAAHARMIERNSIAFAGSGEHRIPTVPAPASQPERDLMSEFPDGWGRARPMPVVQAPEGEE